MDTLRARRPRRGCGFGHLSSLLALVGVSLLAAAMPSAFAGRWWPGQRRQGAHAAGGAGRPVAVEAGGSSARAPHSPAARGPLLAAPAPAPAGRGRRRPSPAERTRLSGNYGRIPLHFEENCGQSDPRVKFLARGRGYTLFLTATEAVMSLRSGDRDPDPRSTRQRRPQRATATVLRMKLAGANRHPRLAGLQELPGKASYFIGNDPRKWRANVPTYARVRYRDVYPGVDLVYYGNQGSLEYDFVVAPGADPRAISLAFDGAEKTWVDAHGDLLLRAGGGGGGRPVHDVRFRKPRVYQEVAGRQVEIASGWAVDSKSEVGSAECGVAAHLTAQTPADRKSKIENRKSARFALASYDHTYPLVIDPVLAYATCLGGSDIDFGYHITVDAQGCAYVTGYADSTNFPVTAGGTLHKGASGTADAFVTKLAASGTSLVYSTCLGGAANTDNGYGIAVDALGCAYVVGHTYSSDFPVTAGGTGYHAGWDAFVAKLSASGTSLVYSTCLGGTSQDYGHGIAVDGLGCAYVTGQTVSSNFPVTAGGTAYHGSGDVFVTKLSAAGTTMAYSTCLGGTAEDEAMGVAIDGLGCAYVTGRTKSTTFPVTAGGTAYHGTGSYYDAFAMKVAATGTSLVYSTCLGGASTDVGYGIAVDGDGQAYTTGVAGAADFPVTTGGAGFHGGSYDAFVTMLPADGASPVYSTCLGASGNDYGYAIAIDGQGRAYVTGYTESPTFPITTGGTAYAGGSEDAFVTQLSADGTSLLYSTCLGGTGYDEGKGIALDAQGAAYITGGTLASAFPITPGGTGNRGSWDAFVAKYVFNGPPAIACTNATVTVNEGSTAANTGTWSDPEDDVVALSASSGNLEQFGDGTWAWSLGTTDGPSQGGTVTITAQDAGGAITQVPFTLTVNNLAPTVAAPADPSTGQGVAYSFTLGSFTDPGADASWSVEVDWGDTNTTTFTMATAGAIPAQSHTYADAGDWTVTVAVTDKDGGIGSSAFTAHVSPSPTVSVGAPSATLTTSGPVTYPVTFSVPVSGFATAGVQVDATGTAVGTVGVTGDGTDWIVTLSSIAGDGTLGITVKANAATDALGSGNTASSASGTFVVDNTAPSSALNAVASPRNTHAFAVSWTAGDGSGSGVAKVHLYYSRDGDPYAEFGSGFTGNSSWFTCQNGWGTYALYTCAEDNAGHREAAPAAPDATVTVAPTVSIGDATVPEGNAGTTALTFTVSLSQESPDPVSVDFTTADGSAAAGSDYTAAAGTLTFAPGETVKTVDVNVLGDTANEEDERFTVTLAHPTGAVLGRAEGTGTLVNDDSLPALSTGDATQAEANGGLTAFTFTVSLSAASARVVTVDYATADDTAIGLGDDYVSAAGTVRFAPGQTSRAITVYVCGDRAHEPDEMFTVALADPMNASLADAEGIGTITNDDAVPSLSVADAVTDEGNSGTGFLHFTVTLSAPSSAAVQVAFATSPGSAGAADFTAAAGALVFSPGEVSRQFHVDILGDTTDEYDERFVVTLSDPVNATIAQARAVGCILNDDDAPTLSAGDVTAAEGDVGNKVASLTVSLSAASSKVVVVDYSCGDTTAVAGSDYAPVAGTLRFAAGQTSRTVNLIYKGDSVREGNEMFRLILSNPVHSTIARGTGIATITCDDSIEAAVGLTVQAADAAVGKTFAATVRAADGAGNTDISFNATVSLALKSGPAGATLAGVTTTHAVAGIARFSALLLMKPGTYVLAATGGGFSADSNSFTVSAGVPARLAFAQPPTNGIAGQALAPIQVALTDNWGNVHPDAGAEVTLQLQNNPGSANLLGTTTVATVNGIATFTNVAVSAPASGLTLRAMASSLRWVTSAPFTISPAGPKKVAFLTQPSNAVANAVIAPPVRVAVQDALGNTLTTATSPVTILLYANPAGARLLGTRTVNAVEGIATFADLKVDRAAAGLRLRASGTGLSGADSTVFEVRALP